MGRVPAFVRYFLVLSIIIAALTGVRCAAAEDPNATVVEGYVTALYPDGFQVKHARVVVPPSASYFTLGGSETPLDEAHSHVALGMFVLVIGTTDWGSHTVVATVIKFRDDSNQAVSGTGVIDRVIATGPEPAFRADGYTVRVNSATDTLFAGGITSLNQVGPNTWMKFEGKRNEAGEVIATKARFARPKIPNHKRDPRSVQVTVFPPGSMIGFDGAFTTDRAKHRMEDAGGWCGWYPVVENAKIQEDVRRIGVSLVPQYQRDLPDDDPAKIPFRFYVVEDKAVRSDIFCSDGLVLVPLQAIQRLRNDAQVAALLADGVAGELQRQRARLMLDMGFIGAAEAAAYLAARNTTAWVAAAGVTGAIVSHEIQRKMEDERGRVALGLLSDAGFDPWQAPEAWRLLEPRNLPKNFDKLKFPARSTYLLSVLGSQYKNSAPAAAPVSGNAAQ